MSNPTILVTGAAGFIGFHLSRRLASEGYQVLGVDNMNEYYDVNLKRSRLQILKSLPGFSFTEIDLRDKAGVNDIVASNKVSYAGRCSVFSHAPRCIY
jgi:UDP-glucuronate 4-epimerase